MTAYENMEMHGVFYHIPRKIRTERIEQLLRLFELWERRKDQVKTFSGGMKRRLEIARGLLHTPKILFLDEPTLGLDPQTRNQLWTQVKELNVQEHVTVFLTTHYMEEAERVAHRLAIIDHGRIVAQGTPAELKEQTRASTLVAPVPRLTIMVGRTLGGATIAVLQGFIVAIVCLIVGFRMNTAAGIPLAVIFMALVALMFTALGTAIASTMQDFQGFQLVMN